MGDGIQRTYALIVNGDPDEARHFNNVDQAVETLLEEDPNYHIAVASARRPAAAVAAYLPPNANNLIRLIRGLARKADDDDLVLLYVTGHGGEGKKQEGCVGLPEGCLSNETLAAAMKAIPFGKRVVIMDDCYSGGAVPLFSDAKTTLITAGSPGEVVSCQNFSPYLWAEQVPDGNGDGVVTLAERYQHAIKTGQALTFSHYFAPTAAISLSGISESTPPFPPIALTVHSGAQLKGKLNGLQPGQLALVLFSAEWCQPCHQYWPHFQALAKKYGGQFQMIRAEGLADGPGGTEDTWEDWAAWGVKGPFPTVAFIDSRGGMLPVPTNFLNDPIKYLLKFPVFDLTDKQKQAIVLQMALEVPFIKQLDQVFLDSNPSLGIRDKINGFLSEVHNEKYALLVHYLTVRLKHPKPLVRSRAALSLGVLEEEDPQAVEPLLELLQDPDPMVQLESVLALAKIAGPKIEQGVTINLGGGMSSTSFRARDWLSWVPQKKVSAKIAELRRHPRQVIRQGALFAQQLTLNKTDPDYPGKAAALYLEFLEDPDRRNQEQGLAHFFKTVDKKPSYFDYKKLKPFIRKIAAFLKKNPEVIEEMGRLLEMTSDFRSSMIPEVLVLIIVETGDHSSELVQRIRLAQDKASDPTRRKMLTMFYEELRVRGNYLGLALPIHTPVTEAEGFSLGGGAQLNYGHRFSRIFEWQSQGGVLWNHNPAVEGLDHRIEATTGPSLYLPKSFAGGRLDLYFSLQAGAFHLVQEKNTGFTSINGFGLQYRLTEKILLDTAAQMALDIPGSGPVQLSARLPIGLRYQFE